MAGNLVGTQLGSSPRHEACRGHCIESFIMTELPWFHNNPTPPSISSTLLPVLKLKVTLNGHQRRKNSTAPNPYFFNIMHAILAKKEMSLNHLINASELFCRECSV
jgi:hypothetical protein